MRLVATAAVVAAFAVVLLVWSRRGPEPPATPPAALDAGAVVSSPPVPQLDASAPPDSVGADARGQAPDPLGARAEREQVLGDLRASGLANEDWGPAAETLLGSIARGQVEATDAGCFIAGCGMTYTFPSEAAARRGLDELQQSDAFRAWTGGKRFTAPELLGDGRVVVALVLYRPD